LLLVGDSVHPDAWTVKNHNGYGEFSGQFDSLLARKIVKKAPEKNFVTALSTNDNGLSEPKPRSK
jgi:hypothetical protein